MRSSPIIPLFGLLAVLACETARMETHSGASVRDSAGIMIVESGAPEWSAAEAWRLSDNPILDIGVVEGESAYELYRPLGAVRLTDGRIVVANRGTLELRYFDPDGVHLFSIGGRGGGPGEFQDLSWFSRVEGDSVVAYDRRNRRLSVFEPGGAFARSVRLQGADFPLVDGRHPDGRYLARILHGRRPGDPRPTGRGRDSLSVVVYEADGRLLDTLGVFLRRIKHTHSMDFRGRNIQPELPLPFTPTTVLAVADDRIVVGTNRDYQVGIYASDGRLEALVRKQHVRLPVDPGDTERFIDSVRALYGDGNPEGEVHLTMLETTPPLDSLPAYERILVDPHANMWILAARRPGDWIPSWNVFRSDGVWLGTVQGPDGLRATDIGADYVLGLWKDESDVEHVLMYSLIKPDRREATGT